LMNLTYNFNIISDLYATASVDRNYVSLLSIDRNELLKARVILDKIMLLAIELDNKREIFTEEMLPEVLAV